MTTEPSSQAIEPSTEGVNQPSTRFRRIALAISSIWFLAFPVLVVFLSQVGDDLPTWLSVTAITAV